MTFGVTRAYFSGQGWDAPLSSAATHTETALAQVLAAAEDWLLFIQVIAAHTDPFATTLPTSTGAGPTWSLVGKGSAPGGSYIPTSAIYKAHVASSTTCDVALIWGANNTSSGDGGIFQMNLVKATDCDLTTPIGGFGVNTGGPGNGATTLAMNAAPSAADLTWAQSIADENTSNKGAVFGTGTWTTIESGLATGKTFAINSGYRSGYSADANVNWSDTNTGGDNFGSTQAAAWFKAAAGAPAGAGPLWVPRQKRDPRRRR